jgi:phospholipid/cholesterol/gamma-HCH transport system substrate-binding protein
VIAAVGHISDTAQSANHLIETATSDIKSILDSANRITADIREIADGIRDGRGTVGPLFNDQELAGSVKQAVRDTQKTAQNLRDATGSAKIIVAKIDDSNIVPEIQQTVKNLQQITLPLKETVDKFQSAPGEVGIGENFQRTLADVHEAMSDLSEDTEALKHNFLFRGGGLKNRGFYDLASVSAPEYKAGSFGKGFQRHRIWLGSADLFIKDAKGMEVLSNSGKKRLDEAMAETLQFPRNGPLMVEGYAGDGSASRQYLQSRSRAVRVQTYITYQFYLSPAYVGIVAMGAMPPESGVAGTFLNGVSLVSFFKK